MRFLERIKEIFEAKTSAAMDKLEDPRETLDLAYNKHQEAMTELERSIVEVTTSKKRMAMQVIQLKAGIEQLDFQAKRAMDAGKEDAAKSFVARKLAMEAQIPTLEASIVETEKHENELKTAQTKLQIKIDTLRNQKETIKAQYSAVEAQVKISEQLTGIGKDMANIGQLMQRAEDKTATMQARAGAINQLVDDGTLSDGLGVTAPTDADIEAELSKLKGK
jgi:phage shock protein A